jgi:hypothetical protein
MIRESILELAEAAPPELRPIVISACLESALLRTFHEASAFSCLCLTGASALRYGSGRDGLYPAGASGWGELRFRLFDKKGYSPERWLFKAQRHLRFMGIDSRIGFTRKASSHAGWIRTPGLVDPLWPGNPASPALPADLANLESPADSRAAIDPKLVAAPPGVKVFIDMAPEPAAGPVPGRIVLFEGWGECFSLRLEG